MYDTQPEEGFDVQSEFTCTLGAKLATLEENAITLKKTGRLGHAVSQLGIHSVLLFYPEKHPAKMRR